MIIFETQEEFEDAVMQVLKDRLKVLLTHDQDCANALTLEVCDRDWSAIDSDSVSLS